MYEELTLSLFVLLHHLRNGKFLEKEELINHTVRYVLYY